MLVVDSITKLPSDARGAVAICASHGGVYPAFLAARAGLRAVVLHDAGVGLEEAGIACLGYLEALGAPAAVVAHTSARIGDARDMERRGVVSAVNGPAAALGAEPGVPAAECARRLADAPPLAVEPPPYEETRFALASGTPPVIGLDSISLAAAGDERCMLVSGSHGGLLGGDPAAALRVDALAAVYNDAGVGIDDAGIGRLPALDERGIPAATVDADSARIGSARSTWETGRVSYVNSSAAACGGRPGMRCEELINTLISYLD